MEKRFVLGDLRSLCCRSLSIGRYTRWTVKNKNKKERMGKKSTSTSRLRPDGPARASSKRRREKRRDNKDGQDLPWSCLLRLALSHRDGTAQLPRSRLPRANDPRPLPLVHAFASAGGSSRKGGPVLAASWARYLQQHLAGALRGAREQMRCCSPSHTDVASGAAAIKQGPASHNLSIIYPVTCSLPAGQQT